MTGYTPKLDGTLTRLLEWTQWDALVDALRQRNDGGWYVHIGGCETSAATLTPTQFDHFLWDLTEVLHRYHDEPYLGIVYVDNSENPDLIRIHAPRSAGFPKAYEKRYGPPPGWILSRVPDLL